jgi:hypothetical protein
MHEDLRWRLSADNSIAGQYTAEPHNAFPDHVNASTAWRHHVSNASPSVP